MSLEQSREDAPSGRGIPDRGQRMQQGGHPGVTVAVNGWFAGRQVGSGAYTDRLVTALRAEFPDDHYRTILPAGSRRATPGHGWRKVLFEQWRFPRAAATDDVAHVPYWGAPWRCPVPVVVTIHDLIPLVLTEYRTGVQVRAYIRLVSRTARRATAILADSQHTAADVERLLGIPSARIHVVPLGVAASPSQTTPAAPARAVPGRALADAPWPSEPLPDRYGLYLGGFDPRKNVPVLLEAWRQVFEVTGVPLVVAGEVATSGLAAVSSPAVRLVGAVPEGAKAQLYRNAAVFAYPSRYEGFGLPPLEAMAEGTPVVTSNATSLPEVVGDAGLQVDPTDVRAWSAALIRVLEDASLAEELARRGRERAAGFTWAATARATRAVYATVAALANRPHRTRE